MKPLKEELDQKFLKQLINLISSICERPLTAVQKALPSPKKWSELALKERIYYSAEIFHQYSSSHYPEKMQQLQAIAPNFEGMRGVVFPTVIERYGLDHPEESLDTLQQITRYSTGEFAIRPFIEKYPETWTKLYEWMHDKNEHVRRLASEGCRPILPWGQRIRSLMKNPEPIRRILDTLYQDSSNYVRKSVANNLNDISKDNPKIAKKWVRAWSPQNGQQQRVITHGLRGLLKKGDPEAYPLVGYAPSVDIKAELSIQKNQINFGEEQFFELKIKNNETKKTPLLINLIIYYPRPSKQALRKVFFWKKINPEAGANNLLSKSVAIKDLSTRKHYPGTYKVEVQCNGNIIARQSFEVSESH